MYNHACANTSSRASQKQSNLFTLLSESTDIVACGSDKRKLNSIAFVASVVWGSYGVVWVLTVLFLFEDSGHAHKSLTLRLHKEKG